MCPVAPLRFFFFFFFNDTATTEIYTLSLHDALPISSGCCGGPSPSRVSGPRNVSMGHAVRDRKSTRLNSSHQIISYAVFCLKKKKCWRQPTRTRPTRGAYHQLGGHPRAAAVPQCPRP